MKELVWEAWASIIAFIISAIYIVDPGPYPMGAFTFIAQPLFLCAMASYAWKVVKELRERDVL